jgi:DNA mismatch repair ATPase MutS
VLRDALDALGTFLGFLRRLRGIADEHARAFVSEGWTAFFATLARELDDGYLARVERDLEELRFPRGVRLSAELGPGHKGRRYTLHRVPPRTWRWRDWWRGLFAEKPPAYRFELPPRDEAGAQALGALRNRGLALAATALAQAADHVRAFFGMLRAELAFYVGCLNLHDALAARGVPVCVPLPAPAEARRWACRGLRDAGLALIGERGVVGNTVRADGKTLVLITGPNSGGKSTFLRSVGLAQLMMQAGMFVPAEAFEASVCDGLFTHFKREEDARMERGKLDEELHRMSEIVDRLTARSVLLCNESFEATNEREGSEIARQIVRALVEAGVRVFVVTHLFDLAHGFAVRAPGPALFLRAERQPDGRRTFRMLEGEPLPTSYGEDVYARVFGTPASAALLAPAAGARRA